MHAGNRGRTHRLNSRLLLTHMVVAVTVLAVAALILLAVQAPIRNEFLLQRMSEWLAPTIMAVRTGNIDLLRDNAGLDPTERFLTYLRNQAEAQNARAFLVSGRTSTILFDTDATMVGHFWEPASMQAIDLRPARMRSGMMMRPLSGGQRGTTEFDGQPWVYVSAPLIAPRMGEQIDLVLLRPRLSFLQTIGDALSEIPPGMLLLSLATLALVVYFLSRWTAGAVTRGLTPLIVGTRALAAGNLAYRVDPLASSLDEVRALSTSFNRMAEQVQLSQQAQRDFIANVSHDLKTPLTSIQGYSQALLDGTAATAETQQRAALIISQEAHRLTNLVEEIIDLARMDEDRLVIRLQPVNLNDLIGELVESLAARSRVAGITLTWRPCPQSPTVQADEGRLRRVVANLLDNALTYTPAGGTVAITTSLLSGEPGERAGVEIAVTDDGPGIPADQLDRIFERFFRGDKARTGGRGAGLGLAIVKEIVEAHQGQVGVESTQGAGSRFWVRLPVA